MSFLLRVTIVAHDKHGMYIIKEYNNNVLFIVSFILLKWIIITQLSTNAWMLATKPYGSPSFCYHSWETRRICSVKDGKLHGLT